MNNVMKYIRGFFAFWYDFIIGDAWEVAAGVAFALLVSFLLLRNIPGSAIDTYIALLLPVFIMSLLTYSIWRVRRSP